MYLSYWTIENGKGYNNCEVELMWSSVIHVKGFTYLGLEIFVALVPN
jgi:hypothetical protein